MYIANWKWQTSFYNNLINSYTAEAPPKYFPWQQFRRQPLFYNTWTVNVCQTIMHSVWKQRLWVQVSLLSTILCVKSGFLKKDNSLVSWESMSWWRHQMETFSALQALCAGNSPVTGEFPSHKDQWRGALMVSLICAWTNIWANNGDAGDLRRHRTHYDVTLMVVACLGLVLYMMAIPTKTSICYLIEAEWLMYASVTNHHWFRLRLAAWPAPRPYLSQCWNIVNMTIGTTSMKFWFKFIHFHSRKSI